MNVQINRMDKTMENNLSFVDRQKRREEMKKLRLENGWTVQQIGDKFRISRERVRQIIGNTGWISSPNNLFINKKEKTRKRKENLANLVKNFDSPFISTSKLSKLTGIPYKKIGHLRVYKRHKVESETTTNGQKAEEFVSKILKENKIDNKLMPNRCQYDIELENGKRIEVKSRTHPEKRHTSDNFYLFICIRERKKFKPLPDFLILVINKDIFIIPQNKIPECGAIGFVWPPNKNHHSKRHWVQYHNQFDLLRN